MSATAHVYKHTEPKSYILSSQQPENKVRREPSVTTATSLEYKQLSKQALWIWSKQQRWALTVCMRSLSRFLRLHSGSGFSWMQSAPFRPRCQTAQQLQWRLKRERLVDSLAFDTLRRRMQFCREARNTSISTKNFANIKFRGNYITI